MSMQNIGIKLLLLLLLLLSWTTLNWSCLHEANEVCLCGMKERERRLQSLWPLLLCTELLVTLQGFTGADLQSGGGTRTSAASWSTASLPSEDDEGMGKPNELERI